MTAPTDREAKIAAALAHLCNCYDDHMIAVRNGYSPEEVERRAERYRRAEAEATTLMREPAPDGKALRALRDWACEHSCATDCGDAVRFRPLLREIDRLTIAPVADASDAANDGRQIVLDAIHDVLREAGYAMPLQEQIGAVVQDRDKLRAENARLQTDLAAAEQRQQNAEGIAAQQSVRAERAEGEAMVLRADLAAAREELRTLTVDRDIKVINLTTQLAAARADQAAMARRELEWLLQAMSRWHQAVTDLTPSAGNRRGAIEDVVGTLRLRLAALPQPKPAAEAFRDAAKNCTGEMFGEQAAVKPAAEPQQALTAAIPPLPIDEGRVAKTVEAETLSRKRDADLQWFVDVWGGNSNASYTDKAIAELCRRALAGKEKP